jgi:hypothetical protein
MRTLVLALAAVILLAPKAASAAPPVSAYSGTGGTAQFDQVSSDGCIHTSGQIAVFEVWSLDQPVQRGINIVGQRQDVCAGTVHPFFGSGQPDAIVVVGLSFVHGSGHYVAGNEQGDPWLHLDIDLSWVGHGPVTRHFSVDSDAYQDVFTLGEQRSATLAGTLVIDGAPATLSAVTLIRQSKGVLQH